jgi:hypothetical protein
VGNGIGDGENPEENEKLVNGLHSTRYGVKKQKMKGKERAVMGGPESHSPIERDPEA